MEECNLTFGKDIILPYRASIWSPSWSPFNMEFAILEAKKYDLRDEKYDFFFLVSLPEFRVILLSKDARLDLNFIN